MIMRFPLILPMITLLWACIPLQQHNTDKKQWINDNNQLKEQVRILSEKEAEQKNSIDQLNQQIENLSANILNLNQQIEKNQQTFTKIDQEKDFLQKEHQTLKEESDIQFKKMLQEIQASQKKIQNKDENLSLLEQNLQEKENKLSLLFDELATKENKVLRLENFLLQKDSSLSQLNYFLEQILKNEARESIKLTEEEDKIYLYTQENVFFDIQKNEIHPKGKLLLQKINELLNAQSNLFVAITTTLNDENHFKKSNMLFQYFLSEAKISASRISLLAKLSLPEKNILLVFEPKFPKIKQILEQK